MWEDPIVEEVRRIRQEHAVRFNYDLQAIFDDLKRQEAEEKSRGQKFVLLPPRRVFPSQASARDVS